MSRGCRLLLAISILACVACGSTAHHATRTTGRSFVARVDNPWFPLRPGTTYLYRGLKDGEPTREMFTVTRRTKMIDGARCVVVHDVLYERGRLAERTTDWYTQDTRGNVWYFGEATAELNRKGAVTSTEGSWQAGVDGARPGIYMPAHPTVGQSFRQEFYKGQAEDHFRVVSVTASVRVPYAASMHALETTEWTPLEPDVIDHKFYVRGIGTVKEASAKGPPERSVLISVRRS